MFILLAATLALFGALALYGYLAGSPADSLAFWGMILSLAGEALFLVFTGFFAFASPVVGKLYLAGDQGAIDIATAAFFAGPSTGILYPAGLIGTVGSGLVSPFGALQLCRSGLVCYLRYTLRCSRSHRHFPIHWNWSEAFPC